MTAAWVLFAVAVVSIMAIMVVHFRILSVMEKRMADREAAIYRQQKEATRIVMQTNNATEILANQSRALHDETRLVQQRVDAFFGDPRVQRMLEGGG